MQGWGGDDRIFAIFLSSLGKQTPNISGQQTLECFEMIAGLDIEITKSFMNGNA